MYLENKTATKSLFEDVREGFKNKSSKVKI